MTILQKTQWAHHLKEGDVISSPFLVKFCATAFGKNGKPYFNLILMDQTGEIEARIWDHVEQYMDILKKDIFLFIEGKCQTFQNRRQVVVQKVRVLGENEVIVKDYVPEGHLDAELLYSKLLSFVDSMEDPFYKALAESVLKDDPEIQEGFKKAPAAKSMHHAYQTGLLEHVVSITSILDFLSLHYGKMVNRDLLFLGGFFHDIGKIWELSYARVTDYTSEGKLIGHLVMGVELVDRKIRELESQEGRLLGAFPEHKKLLVKHVILAHHGKQEYGSPKEPHCLEAFIIHMIDDLDSKVNAVHHFIEKDQTVGDWTALNKNFQRYLYKGPY